MLKPRSRTLRLVPETLRTLASPRLAQVAAGAPGSGLAPLGASARCTTSVVAASPSDHPHVSDDCTNAA
jgi:hypothetical protein